LIGSGFGYEGQKAQLRGHLCTQLKGFSLHAAVVIPRPRRDQLERLIRYTSRSSLCLDRLSLSEKDEIKNRFSL